MTGSTSSMLEQRERGVRDARFKSQDAFYTWVATYYIQRFHHLKSPPPPPPSSTPTDQLRLRMLNPQMAPHWAFLLAISRLTLSPSALTRSMLLGTRNAYHTMAHPSANMPNPATTNPAIAPGLLTAESSACPMVGMAAFGVLG